MTIEIDGTLSVRKSAMFVGTVTVHGIAMFDGTVTGRGTPMSGEIGPTPSAGEACATAIANDAFDLHSNGNQLTAIEQLEAID